MQKLHMVDVGGSIWNIFKEHLSNKEQCVAIDSQLSSFLPILSVVFQGSFLGPLFFIL